MKQHVARSRRADKPGMDAVRRRLGSSGSRNGFTASRTSLSLNPTTPIYWVGIPSHRLL